MSRSGIPLPPTDVPEFPFPDEIPLPVTIRERVSRRLRHPFPRIRLGHVFRSQRAPIGVEILAIAIYTTYTFYLRKSRKSTICASPDLQAAFNTLLTIMVLWIFDYILRLLLVLYFFGRQERQLLCRWLELAAAVLGKVLAVVVSLYAWRFGVETLAC